jgi:hypothetical protein
MVQNSNMANEPSRNVQEYIQTLSPPTQQEKFKFCVQDVCILPEIVLSVN